MIRGVDRSRWLGELAQAIDDAQNLVRAYGCWSGPSEDLMDLYARLAAVRCDIDEVCRVRGPLHANGLTTVTQLEADEPFATWFSAVPIRS